MTKPPIICCHCLREEAVHTPEWYCKNFEPRVRAGKRSKAPASGPGLDYIQQAVRTTLSRTLHYVADLLMLDPKLVADATSQLLNNPPSGAGQPLAWSDRAGTPTPPTPKKLVEDKPTNRKHNGIVVLDKAQRAVLMTLANFPDGLTAVRVSLLTGYKRSTRNRILQELKSMGLVIEENRGDREKRAIKATDAGTQALHGSGGIAPLPPRHATRAEWKTRLPSGNATVFDYLCHHFPVWIERSDIDESLNFAQSTRNRMLQELKRLDLIEVHGTQVRAASELFDAHERPSVHS